MKERERDKEGERERKAGREGERSDLYIGVREMPSDLDARTILLVKLYE